MAAIVSRSLATAVTREVKPLLPAFFGSVRRLLAVLRMLCAAEPRFDLELALTAAFHLLIAALLLLLAVLQAAIGSVFGFGLLLGLFALLDDAFADVDDEDGAEDFDAPFDDELALSGADRPADEVLLVDDVAEVAGALVVADEASEELPPEQALSATRPHAAAATTLSRRAWAWVVLMLTECPPLQLLSKSRDARHAPAETAPRAAIAGFASTQLRTCSATQSG